MCMPTPKPPPPAPPPPPPPPPPAPPPEPVARSEASAATQQAGNEVSQRRQGRQSLVNPLAIPLGGAPSATGLNIPT